MIEGAEGAPFHIPPVPVPLPVARRPLPAFVSHGSVPSVSFGRANAHARIHPRHRVALAFSWQDVLDGTGGAPWVWWLAALVVMVALLLLGMKLMGLFPK